MLLEKKTFTLLSKFQPPLQEFIEMLKVNQVWLSLIKNLWNSNW